MLKMWSLNVGRNRQNVKKLVAVSGTLAGAVLYGGVSATAFDRELRAEPVYDGAQALEAGLRSLPEPIGVVSDYRVVVFDGELRHPPLHPSECHRLAILAEPEPEPEEDFCP